VRKIMLLSLLAAFGCGHRVPDASGPVSTGGMPTAAGMPVPGKSGAKSSPVNSGVQDYQEYSEYLKKDVPIDLAAFSKSAWKAESYVEDTEVRKGFFHSLVLKIDPPVTLKNRITGETKEYNRALMVMNRPFPYRIFAWETVQMRQKKD